MVFDYSDEDRNRVGIQSKDRHAFCETELDTFEAQTSCSRICRNTTEISKVVKELGLKISPIRKAVLCRTR